MHELVLLVLSLILLADFWCLKEHPFQTATTELNVSIPGAGGKVGFKLSLKGREGRTCFESFIESLRIRQ